MGRASENQGLVENGAGRFPVCLRGRGARVKPHHALLNRDSLWCDSCQGGLISSAICLWARLFVMAYVSPPDQ